MLHLVHATFQYPEVSLDSICRNADTLFACSQSAQTPKAGTLSCHFAYVSFCFIPIPRIRVHFSGNHRANPAISQVICQVDWFISLVSYQNFSNLLCEHSGLIATL